MRTCYLDKQFRQEDTKFIDILNKIRTNQAGEEELFLLNKRLNETIGDFDKPTKTIYS